MKEIDSKALPEAHRKIADVIGVEAMLKLCAVYGGANLYIPGLATVSTARRDQEIRYLHGIGISSEDIAKRFHVTRRLVQRVVASDEAGKKV